ncbi:unnamed protein product [Porites evermanni]|uniref:Ig-like domain-containing protein n=1 Tax=Porites evermanni TaxID=104178 RepID=A0ABN8QZ27_9CNID|nr:unnamed protein product [Porites evermanni]
MALSSQRNKTLLLGMWIFFCVVYGQSEEYSVIWALRLQNKLFYKFIEEEEHPGAFVHRYARITRASRAISTCFTCYPPGSTCFASGVASACNKRAVASIDAPAAPSSNVPEGFPKVKRHPSRQVKYVGGTAVFNCTAEGDPEPAITWLRGYVPLNSSDPRYTSPSNGVLEISDLKLEDTGKIQCIATNRLGWYYSRKTDLVVEGLCRFIRVV